MAHQDAGSAVTTTTTRRRRELGPRVGWVLAALALLAAACSDDSDDPSAEAEPTPSTQAAAPPDEEPVESVELDREHDGRFVLYEAESNSARVAANLAAPDDDAVMFDPGDHVPIGNLRLPATIETGRLLVPSGDGDSVLYLTRSPLGDDGVAGGGQFVVEIDMAEPAEVEQVAHIPFGFDLLLADPERPGDMFGESREGCFRVGVRDAEPAVLLPGTDCRLLPTGYAVLVAGERGSPTVELSTLDGDVSEFALPERFDVNDLGVNATGDLLYVVGDEGTPRTGAVLFYDVASGEQVGRSPETSNGGWEVLAGSSDGALLVARTIDGTTMVHRPGEEPTALATPSPSQTRAGWMSPDGSVALVLSQISLEGQTNRVHLASYGPDGQQVRVLFEQDFPRVSTSNAAGAAVWVVGDETNATVALEFDGDRDRRELFIGGPDTPLEPVGLDDRDVISVVGDDATGDLVVLINESRSPGIDRFAVVFAGGGGEPPVVDEREGEYAFGAPFVLDMADGEAVLALVDEGVAAAYGVTSAGSSEIGEADGYEKAINRSPEDVLFLDGEGDILLTGPSGTRVCERAGCGQFSDPAGDMVLWSVPPAGRTVRHLFVD